MSEARRTRRAIEELERLRGYRARRERDLGIGAIVDRTRRDFDRTSRSMGAIAEAWLAVVPPELSESILLLGFRGGTLQVEVPGSGLAFELDRRLRSGLLTDLKKASGGRLARVRVRVGSGSTG